MTVALYAKSSGESAILHNGLEVVTLDQTGIKSGVLKTDTTKPTTSGNTITFTGIPSYARRITVILAGVSTAGNASGPMVKVGSGGVVASTGYTTMISQVVSGGATSAGGSGSAIALWATSWSATFEGDSLLTLVRLGTSNTWVFSGTSSAFQTLQLITISGKVVLTGPLDILTLSTLDNFDAGSVNIMYE